MGATQNLAAIRAGLEAVVPPLQHAVVGFSDLVLQVDFEANKKYLREKLYGEDQKE